MNYTPWLVAAALIVLFLLAKRLSLISPAKARSLLTRGAAVIDVRSPSEFRGRHLPGALNVPLDRLGDEIARRAPDKSQPLLLHCLSGTRSAMAKAMLKKMGYRDVHNLGSYARAARLASNPRPS